MFIGESNAVKFPFLFGGTFIEATRERACNVHRGQFPFLFGGTFIEASYVAWKLNEQADFPSFSEGLSLRRNGANSLTPVENPFPFLFGGTFIEARSNVTVNAFTSDFPSFSEGLSLRRLDELFRFKNEEEFPFLFGGAFIEGLSRQAQLTAQTAISLPFRRDFH